MEYDLPRYGFKEMPCRECGEPVQVSVRRIKAPRHLECGVGKAIEASRQMAAKEGPYYDNWAKSMVALGERMRGGGAPEDKPPGGSD